MRSADSVLKILASGSWRRYSGLFPGMLILIPFVLFSIAPGTFAAFDPLKSSVEEMFDPPSASHWFGTDELGRDMLSRVVHGARISLVSASLTVLSACVIGVFAGAVAGYWAGWTGRIIMSLVDILLAFPTILLAMVVGVALGASLRSSMLALIIVRWPLYARLMRGLTLQLKSELYVEAAHAIGGGSLHIIRRHILPNALSAIIVRITLDLGFAVLVLASLGFIGLGVRAPTPEWGAMVSWGRTYFLNAWWIGIFPAVAITLVVVGTSLLGDALNDLLNPNV